MLIATRRKLLLILPINAVLIIGTLIYYEAISSDHVKFVTEGFRNFSSKLEFSYLSSEPEVDNSDIDGLQAQAGTFGTDLLTKNGFQLDRGDVKFKYLGDTSKSPEQVLEDNIITYGNTLSKEITEPKDFDIESIRPPKEEDLKDYKRAKATILSLVRNQEVIKIRKTIKKFERQFNSKFQYPYTFVNDEPFTDYFKKSMRVLSLAEMEFITIPAEVWDKPSWIDEEKEAQAMQKMFEDDIAYAKLALYHNMCRFYLGSFFNLPELQKYKYYWRIEPDVDFYTTLNYDVFKYLEGTGKKYGFNVNLYDIDNSIPTLWPETLKFLNTGDNYKYINPNGAFQWLLYPEQHPKKIDVTGGYSACHFWSNFEIADMDFFRGEAYTEWFKHLESTGKFYYERWGDAPVHLIGVALFADFKKDVHWFRDIGYRHDPYFNCPKSPLVLDCVPGKFSLYGNLNDQNCMAAWINQFKSGELDEIY